MKKKKKNNDKELHIFSVVSDFEISKDGVCFLTPRAVDLIKAVHETGSILAASKEARIAYPQAWNLLDTLNHISDLPVVVRQQGGIHGGGTIVTPFGMRLITRYCKLQAKYDNFILEMEKEIQDLFTFVAK
ncbi:MAG: LysR family transcriptional regulator [Tannerellaceae bacterium]|jgi:molybdate transport system regulatory protein|nr:LysR family transcriptional regulator [Tannerellaceae bacterium]